MTDTSPKQSISGDKSAEGAINTDNINEQRFIKMDHNEDACEECGGLRIDLKLHEVFRVKLCGKCKKSFPLISQSAAMEEYLLCKSDFLFLPKLQVENPMSTMWKPMLLYSKKDIADISRQKFPDLEKEKAQRKEKTKKRREEKIRKKILELKRTARPKIKTEKRHTHSFDAEGVCKCGMQVEQEDI